MKVYVEVTDTFNSEPNYSWVRRYSFEAPALMTDYALVRRAKQACGWNGFRCLTVHHGDMIALHPYGHCMVAFITYEEDSSHERDNKPYKAKA